jgi:hypothetical protein
MGKVVVYIQARDEAELKAAGHDPKEWVKNLVKTTLEERRRTRLFPEQPDFQGKDLK